MGIFGKTDSKPPEPVRPTVAPAPVAPSAPAPRSAPPVAPSSAAAASGPTCTIGPKTRVKGEISGEENVVVEGHVEGSIRVTRDLRVGPGGSVKATVAAQSVVVAGELLGDCQATQRVQIEATGRMTGNIRAPRVVIVEGASFRGNSDMSGRREGEP